MKTGARTGTEDVSKVECWYCGRFYMKSLEECPNCHHSYDEDDEETEYEE